MEMSYQCDANSVSKENVLRRAASCSCQPDWHPCANYIIRASVRTEGASVVVLTPWLVAMASLLCENNLHQHLLALISAICLQLKSYQQLLLCDSEEGI